MNCNDFDIKVIIELLEDFDNDEFETLIEDMKKSAKEYFAEIDFSISNKDLNKCYYFCHSMKGLASNFGLISIVTQIIEMESEEEFNILDKKFIILKKDFKNIDFGDLVNQANSKAGSF